MQRGHNKGPICFTNSPGTRDSERDVQRGFFRVISHSIKQELLICRCFARVSVLQPWRKRESLEVSHFTRSAKE